MVKNMHLSENCLYPYYMDMDHGSFMAVHQWILEVFVHHFQSQIWDFSVGLMDIHRDFIVNIHE